MVVSTCWIILWTHYFRLQKAFNVKKAVHIVCYAIAPPGRKSGLRAGFRVDSMREILKIGPPAGRRADFAAFPIWIRPKSGPEA